MGKAAPGISRMYITDGHGQILGTSPGISARAELQSEISAWRERHPGGAGDLVVCAAVRRSRFQDRLYGTGPHRCAEDHSAPDPGKHFLPALVRRDAARCS